MAILATTDYLLNRVQFVGHHWLWTRHLDRGGYAQSGRGRASRLSYKTFVGPIPHGYEIGHVDCPYRHCISPACLSAMTPQQNSEMIPKSNRQHVYSVHAAKTHCPKGHPYDDVNTYKYRGGRICKECHRAAVRKHRKWQS